MADVNDPSKFRHRFEQELGRLDRAHPADRADLRTWANAMTTAYSTRYGHLHRARLLSERIDGSLADADLEGFYELHDRFRRGDHPDIDDDGLAEGTLRQYRQSARLFFRDALGRDWAEDITVGAAEPGSVTKDDILGNEEVSALFDAAPRARERALMGVLLTTGQRISAVLSLRIGDVDLGGRVGTIHLNDEALGLKGASGPRPIIWASGFAANWMADNPNRGLDDEPYFCALQGGETTIDGTTYTWERGDALSREQAWYRLKGVAEAAGVDPNKVKPHNFRHTAITRMDRDNVPEQKIKWMVGWGADSSQFERYDHLDDEEMMQGFLAEYGLEDERGPSFGVPDLSECTRCHRPLRPGAEFCDACGLPLNQRAADEVSDQDDRLFESAVGVDGELADDLRAIKRRLQGNPRLREFLLRE